METGIVIIIALISIAVGAGLGYWLYSSHVKQEKARLQIKTENILVEAEEKAKEVELQAKDKAIQLRQQADAEVSRRRTEISREEDRVTKRRDELENRTDRQEKREAALNKRQSAIDKRANDVEQMYENEMAELKRISEMTQEEARGVLIAEVEKGARDDMARIIRQVEAEAQEDGDRRGRENNTTSLSAGASAHER